MSKSPQQRKEPLSLRIEPKIKYLIEIASRIQRRNISNYVEYVIEDSLKNVGIEKDKSVYDAATTLWSPNEFTRIFNLWKHYPNLLTFEEEKIIEIIKTYYIEPSKGFPVKEANINIEVEHDWDIIKSASIGDVMSMSWIIEKLRRGRLKPIDIYMAPPPDTDKVLKFLDCAINNKKFIDLTSDKIKDALKKYLHFFTKDPEQEVKIDNIDIELLKECWELIVDVSFSSFLASIYFINMDGVAAYIQNKRNAINKENDANQSL